MWLDGLARGGGALRHHGGVDDMKDEEYATIYPEDFSMAMASIACAIDAL
jgi:hypothetical protein